MAEKSYELFLQKKKKRKEANTNGICFPIKCLFSFTFSQIFQPGLSFFLSTLSFFPFFYFLVNLSTQISNSSPWLPRNLFNLSVFSNVSTTSKNTWCRKIQMTWVSLSQQEIRHFLFFDFQALFISKGFAILFCSFVSQFLTEKLTFVSENL